MKKKIFWAAPIMDVNIALLQLACIPARKIGKLNHFKDIESQVDWANFLSEATKLLQKVKADYYIKKDLAKFAPDFRST